MPRFDPHDHLVKQGWRGKGTEGHSTRHVAAVQKKSNSGIGKDRDEAIPFWDHIFASTAASLASGQSSGASTPTETISIAARSGRELAKRKLYSSFYRGSKALQPKGSEEDASDGSGDSQSASEVAPAAESSRALRVVKETETKEERRARKAARRERRAAKEAARATKAAAKLDREARRVERRARKEKSGEKVTRAKVADAGEGATVKKSKEGKEKDEKKDKKSKAKPTA